MGCHTLVYKLERELTEQEQSFIIETEKEWLLDNAPIDDCGYQYEEVWDVLYNSCSITEVQDKLPHFDFEGAEGVINYMVRTKTGLSDAYGIVRGNKLYRYLYCDYPFRMYGYPEEEFTDAQSLIDFISKEPYNKMVYYYNDDEGQCCNGVSEYLNSKIQQFFSQNDDILVLFG